LIHFSREMVLPRGFVGRRAITELMRRQRVLTIYALMMLALMVPTLVLLVIDSRTIGDVSVWAKPLKFMASTALFSLSTAWFMGLLPHHTRVSPANRKMVWTLILTSLFEVTYISFQAGSGSPSHYNVADSFHAAMFGLMAVAAILLTATQAFLAWQLLKHAGERPIPIFHRAVIAGLIMTFLLSTVSGLMLGGHQPPPGMGLPLVGWHLSGGDLRPAHFLGVHAQQIIPLAGFILQRHAPTRAGSGLLAMTVLSYTAIWLLLSNLGLSVQGGN